MVIFDVNGNVVENPDMSLGRVDFFNMTVYHSYVIDVAEQGHEEVVAVYPNGGQQVVWVVDVEEQGHWETRDEDGNIVAHFDGFISEDWPKEQITPNTWEYGVYTLYTQAELEELALLAARVAVYTVDKGTSGAWEYEKYYDGKYECWASVNTSGTLSSSYGSKYYKDIAVNFPITFASVPTVEVTMRSSIGIPSASVCSCSTSSVGVRIADESNQIGETVTAVIRVIGAWK